MQFGRRAGDSDNKSGKKFEFYIKNFQAASTLVTFLWDNPNEWKKCKQHFDRKLNIFYPCSIYGGGERCVGCHYPVAHPEWNNAWVKADGAAFGVPSREVRNKLDPGWAVRDARYKYVSPVVVEGSDFANLFQVGFQFWKDDLVPEYEDTGSLATQQYRVTRSGDGLDTTYRLKATGKPPVKPGGSVPGVEQIEERWGQEYERAFLRYVEVGLTNEDGTQVHDPELPYLVDEVAVPEAHQARPAKAGRPVAARPSDSASEALAAVKAAKTAGLGRLFTGPDLPEGWDPALNAREASLVTLRDWLDRHPEGAIEYPPKASRTALVALVEKQLAQSTAPF